MKVLSEVLSRVVLAAKPLAVPCHSFRSGSTGLGSGSNSRASSMAPLSAEQDISDLEGCDLEADALPHHSETHTLSESPEPGENKNAGSGSIDDVLAGSQPNPDDITNDKTGQALSQSMITSLSYLALASPQLSIMMGGDGMGPRKHIRDDIGPSITTSDINDGDSATIFVREVVEIKSTCPFATLSSRRNRGGGGGGGWKKKNNKGKRGGGKGGGYKLEWVVSDRGPRNRCSPL